MRILSSMLLFLILASCNSGDSSKDKVFKMIISDTSKPNVRNTYKYRQAKTNALNISGIDDGVDSFELRLWVSSALVDLNFITILKYSDSNWHLTETRYWISSTTHNSHHTFFSLDSSTTRKVNPGIAFSKIIDSINLFRIDSIPSQFDIPNFVDRTADGVGYTIEIATKHYYKTLSYGNPKFYTDINNKKVTEILDFLRRNLGAFVTD